MPKITEHIKLYLPTLPVIILASWIIKNALRTEGCFGMPGGLLAVALWVLLVIAMLVTLPICLRRIKKNEINKYFVFSIYTVLVLVALVVTALPRFYFKSKVMMQAEMPGAKLILRENKTYTILRKEPEWTCYHHGNYHINNDTLQLDKDDKTAQTKYLVTQDSLLTSLQKPISQFRIVDKFNY